MTISRIILLENTVFKKSITKESYIVTVCGLRPVKLKITIALSLTLKKKSKETRVDRAVHKYLCVNTSYKFIILVRYYYVNAYMYTHVMASRRE